MKNPYIIPAAMICAAILAGFWMLKPPSEQPQKVVIVQPPPQPPDISIWDAAINAGNIEAIKQHIAAGTDVNAKADGGLTPLHVATFNGVKEAAALLIAGGANLEMRDDLGQTALHMAAYWSGKEMAELLIAAGANVNAHQLGGEKNIGKTPLDRAIDNDKTETAALLRKYGGKSLAD